MCNKDYQDFGKYNNLRITLTHSVSNMSLSSCLLVYVDKATLRHVHIQCRNTTQKTMTSNF